MDGDRNRHDIDAVPIKHLLRYTCCHFTSGEYLVRSHRAHSGTREKSAMMKLISDFFADKNAACFDIGEGHAFVKDWAIKPYGQNELHLSHHLSPFRKKYFIQGQPTGNSKGIAAAPSSVYSSSHRVNTQRPVDKAVRRICSDLRDEQSSIWVSAKEGLGIIDIHPVQGAKIKFGSMPSKRAASYHPVSGQLWIIFLHDNFLRGYPERTIFHTNVQTLNIHRDVACGRWTRPQATLLVNCYNQKYEGHFGNLGTWNSLIRRLSETWSLPELRTTWPSGVLPPPCHFWLPNTASLSSSNFDFPAMMFLPLIRRLRHFFFNEECVQMSCLVDNLREDVIYFNQWIHIIHNFRR